MIETVKSVNIGCYILQRRKIGEIQVYFRLTGDYRIVPLYVPLYYICHTYVLDTEPEYL
jgi:hypothetical protein